jgi:predicted PurR-regulated permease PerM
MNLNENSLVIIVVAIVAIVIIIKIIFDSRRPIITYTKNPIDPITQRIQAIRELSSVNFLSASQLENLIEQALKNVQTEESKNENSNNN